MAVDMFIKIGKIEGESQDSSHKGEIDVLAWSWGMSQSGTMHGGGGGGAGKVHVNDLSFTKYVDKATPNLMLSCMKGDHIDEAKLVVRKAGTNPLEYIEIKMTGLIITSVSAGGSGGEDRLTENITLNFGKVEYKYTPQKPDGGKDTPIPIGWDIAKNVKV